jgi:RimJ/RimL family protein N-acetyltransferase
VSLGDIETSVVDGNAGSARVLEKCGFTRTGIVVEEWSKQQEPVRLVIYRRDRSGETASQA